MVAVSIESPAQTEARLRQVIGAVDLRVYEELYGFEEFPLQSFFERLQHSALALVRDGEVWSQLVPDAGQFAQSFTVFCFHFPPELDNSGFVGWLATHLKIRFGTGVFVVCGQNSRRGGIFDYWACPAELGGEVVAEVRALIKAGAAARTGRF